MQSSKMFISSYRFQLITTVAVILSLIILLLFSTFFLRVQQINCVIEPNTICLDELVDELSFLSGEFLLFNNIDERVSNSNIITQQYRVLKVKKDIFGSVTVHLKPQDILYSLKMNGVRHVVTSQGSMIPSGSDVIPTTLSDCTVELPEQLKMTTELKVDQGLHDKITLLIQGLNNRMMRCATIRPVDQNTWLITLKSSDEKQIVINPADSDVNLDRLSVVLSAPIESEESIANIYLDVRFSMPVLRKTL